MQIVRAYLRHLWMKFWFRWIPGRGCHYYRWPWDPESLPNRRRQADREWVAECAARQMRKPQ